MNITKIAGLSIAAVLVLAFVIPQLSAGALTGESKVLKTILGLTEQAKSLLSNTILPTLDTIKDDLQFKKKFWQYEPCKDLISDPSRPTCWFVVDATSVGVAVQNCNLPDRTACAFNVESIQLPASGANVEAIIVDGAFTDISDKGITTPTNLLIDTGIGKIGASSFVVVLFDNPLTGALETYTGPVEFNGEKPQAMELCTESGGQNPCTED